MPSAMFKILLPVVVVIIVLTAFGERGLLRSYKLAAERDDIRKKIEKLSMENQFLRRELTDLKTDKRYIEEIARRELGLVREGETVYRFRDETR